MSLYDDKEQKFLDQGHKLLKSGVRLACALVPLMGKKDPKGTQVFVLLRRARRFPEPQKLRAVVVKHLKRLKAEGHQPRMSMTVYGFAKVEDGSLAIRAEAGRLGDLKQPRKKLKTFGENNRMVLFKRTRLYEVGEKDEVVAKDDVVVRTEVENEQVDAFLGGDATVDEELLASLEEEEDREFEGLFRVITGALRDVLDQTSIDERAEGLTQKIPGFASAAMNVHDALETVTDQLESLQTRVLAVGKEKSDPSLTRIGEELLNKLALELEDQLSHVEGLLDDLESATQEGDPLAGPAGKLSGHLERVATFLGSDRRVKVCDENPFEVPVQIRATLGSAVTKLKEAVDGVRD